MTADTDIQQELLTARDALRNVLPRTIECTPELADLADRMNWDAAALVGHLYQAMMLVDGLIDQSQGSH